MGEPEPAGLTSGSVGSSAATPPEAARPRLDGFERAKRSLLLACGAIGGGLAVAGTIDSSTGGVLLLAGWAGAVFALHRLGRTGSDRGEAPTTRERP
ncbi:MAG TPA: hypothetical protein VM925_08120 [Labilithrix sp.]|jgi:hypothetical protein|nr:hypothetical protein [Labilithrix sp.]